MGLFKRITEQNLMFTKRGEHKYKVLLNLEKTDDSYIISYLDDKIKHKIKITEKSINDYVFLEKSKNFFYKKYLKVDPQDLIKEMDTGGVGVGGTAPDQFSGDFYAPNDARNIWGTDSNKKPPMVRRPKITDTFNKSKKKKKNKDGNKKESKKDN